MKGMQSVLRSSIEREKAGLDYCCQAVEKARRRRNGERPGSGRF